MLSASLHTLHFILCRSILTSNEKCTRPMKSVHCTFTIQWKEDQSHKAQGSVTRFVLAKFCIVWLCVFPLDRQGRSGSNAQLMGSNRNSSIVRVLTNQNLSTNRAERLLRERAPPVIPAALTSLGLRRSSSRMTKYESSKNI